ncbi:MAG: hypothetical protein PHY09_03270 [Desulfuromonadaceae bacterium]|nr:hypothetical protein [Desulfuromonadaceae bacterium]MDD5104515.1 hypothetical protein [Desulfuromonadaceae bacterium]
MSCKTPVTGAAVGQWIIVTGDEVTIKGSSGTLVGAVKYAAQKKNLSTREEVLRFGKDGVPGRMNTITGKCIMILVVYFKTAVIVIE